MNDQKQINVCIYCEKWADGGIESFLLNVLEEMDISNVKVDLVISKLESDLYIPRLERLQVEMIELSGSVRQVLKNHLMFRKLLYSNKYDVVYINIYHALSIMYAWDASNAGVQNRIVHSHNNGLRNSCTKPLKMILHNICKKFFSGYITSQLACSAEAANFMFTNDTEWKWIPNGINLDKFCFNEMKRRLMRENLKIKENTVLIGNVGRLCYQKNQRFLLELSSKLRGTCDDFILLLVGSGEDEKALKDLTKELKIEDKIVFYGNSNDIVSLYCAMDIFVLPSHFEGLGIVAIEAQAMGLPVLCSNYVPKEAMITGLIESLAIDDNTEPWENRIKEISLRLDRKQVTNEIRNAGYDINSVAQIIQKEWIKNEKTSRSKSS